MSAVNLCWSETQHLVYRRLQIITASKNVGIHFDWCGRCVKIAEETQFGYLDR